jgi:hypothetical protein
MAIAKPVPDEDLIDGYPALVAALVARRHQLGLTQEMLDDRAGFSSGHTAHLETWDRPNGRRSGDVTLALWLGALGLRIKLVDVGRPHAAGRAPGSRFRHVVPRSAAAA